MKKCQSCGFVNADEMRFCVECGTPLATAPMVFNLQDSGIQKQSTVDTTSFDKSMETKIGGRQNFTPNFPTAAPSRGRSKSKILLVVGGLFALFMLLLMAGAAIVFFNWKPDKPVIIADKTPTPAPTRTVEKPSPTATPTPKPLPSPSVTPSPKSTSGASGSFDKMSVDFNVTENNRLGMRIHVNFSAYNLKGEDCDLTIRFQDENGSFLETDSGGYKNKNGEIIVKRELKPAYDNAVYEDLQLFMPYNALDLPRGKYNLKMDVDLTYENGDVIQHLNFYDFKYEEK